MASKNKWREYIHRLIEPRGLGNQQVFQIAIRQTSEQKNMKKKSRKRIITTA